MLVASACLYFGGSSAAAISANNKSSGISISPFVQEIIIDASDVEKSYTLRLTNNTSVVQTIALRAQDIGSLNETGGVLLEGSKGFSQKYGLTSWLSLEKSSVVIDPGKSAEVLATVSNRETLQPGGHYGAVIATINAVDPKTGNEVTVQQELTSLLLINKAGGAKYDLKLAGATHNGNLVRLPDTVRLRFQNPGNVHVVPRGIVHLRSPSGQVVAQGIINDESAYVLPESYRQMYVELKPMGKQFNVPGEYSIDIDYRYDEINRYATVSQQSRYLNPTAVAGVALAILVVSLVGKRLTGLHHKK